MIKAVLFDLDDTLYRERDFVEQAFCHAAVFFAGYLEERRKKFREQEKNAEDVLHSESPEALTEQMLGLMEQEGRGEIFNRLCERYGADIPVQELVRIYRETEPTLSLYPDGEAFLSLLKEKNILTGLITDGNAEVQHRKIRALGLYKRLDVVLASYDLGLSKPDPEVYAYCGEKLGCAPAEMVYIGDNPLKDFIGARKLGMKTVRIIRPEGMHMGRKAEEGYEADMTIHLLTELAPWFLQEKDAMEEID